MNQEIKNTFFEALSFPEYARPFFYLKKQQESGWHKAVFFHALCEQVYAYKERFEILSTLKRDRGTITLSIEEETKGVVKGKFDIEKLNELEIAVFSSYEIDKSKKEFDDFSVISLVEYSLNFIKTEFKIISKEISAPHFRYSANAYSVYFIALDGAPYFDFVTFRNVVRKLTSESRDPGLIKTILGRINEITLDIIRMWNEKIYLSTQEKEEDNSELNSNTLRVEFVSESLTKFWRVSRFELFDLKSPKRFLLYDLADFAAKITNFISSEVLRKRSKEYSFKKKDFIEDLLRGIRTLQENDIAEYFIKEFKGNNVHHEAPFRDWFRNWFEAAGYKTQKEALKGNDRMDLAVWENSVGKKVIEFKGWWNPSREEIIIQLHNYLTEFEGDGYVFLINEREESVLDSYKQIVDSHGNNCLSWELLPNSESSFCYFRSKHKIGIKERIIYHFVYNVFHTGKLKRVSKVKNVRRNKS